MTARRSRAELLPNANNPRLLLRMLDCICTGIRRPRALADVLEVDVRTVHYYTQAAEWLALLAGGEHLQLTPRGLQLAYSSEGQRRQCYADAVWANPFVQQLMAGRTRLPEAHNLVVAILEWEPQLSPSTAHRRASAVRALVEPALSRPPSTASNDDQGQVDLPFQPTTPSTPTPSEPILMTAGKEENPDAYAVVLSALIDNGELSTPQIRALLDAAGATDCSLSGCVEMIMRRGDGHRVDERIVVSVGALQRRDVSHDGVLIALSDPLYRRHLTLLSATAPDPSGEQRRLARRFSPWDRRIFGAPLHADDHQAKLSALLVGRQLASIPIATPAPAPLIPSGRPFVDALDSPSLLIAFPSSITQIAAGVAEINPLLRSRRQNPVGIRLPTVVDARTLCHGGLLHPGERPPTAIADNRSLRLRAIGHCPALSMLCALLLLDRRRRSPLQIRAQSAQTAVAWKNANLGGPLSLFTAFSRDRGWQVSHPSPLGSRPALTDQDLVNTARKAKIIQMIGDRFTLHESLFVLLQEDHEARAIYEPLMILEDQLCAWLEKMEN